MKPTLGRIVNFILPNGAVRPAIVTHVHGIKAGGYELVNLQVFTDGPNDTALTNGPLWRENVSHAEPSKDSPIPPPGTWHWPAKVK